jgi:hypothetical protein
MKKIFIFVCFILLVGCINEEETNVSLDMEEDVEISTNTNDEIEMLINDISEMSNQSDEISTVEIAETEEPLTEVVESDPVLTNDDIEVTKENVVKLDLTLDEHELLAQLFQMDIRYEKDIHYLIKFTEDEIKCGYTESEYYSFEQYSECEYNPEELSFTFHITSERIIDYENDEIVYEELDYYCKIILTENGFAYLFKYDTEEEVESEWIFYDEKLE